MARIRSIHPGIFTDEAWVSCAPLTRLLFFGLLTDADDQGVFEWKPLQIKMRLLPGDVADVGAMLDEMAAVDLVKAFEHGGKRFGAIRNFRKHQRPKKPNSIHFLPEELRTYVALNDASSDHEADDLPPVGNWFPTHGENPPQMEDGGWRMEDVSDASASSQGAGDEFAALWTAYPHTKGRSSPPKSELAFRAAPPEVRHLLSGAAVAFARSGAIPKGGAPALEKWLTDERYRDWLTAPDARDLTIRSPWSGPSDVRQAFATALGEDWAASYIDPCGWQDVPDRALLPATKFGGAKIVSEGRKVLSALGLTVLVERAA